MNCEELAFCVRNWQGWQGRNKNTRQGINLLAWPAHHPTAMADAPSCGIAGLEMLVERVTALESHARVATAWRRWDAEALPGGTELTSDLYDCGTEFRIKKWYEGRLDASRDLVVLYWDSALERDTPDQVGWCQGVIAVDTADRAAERAVGEAEAARLRTAYLPLLQSREEWDTISTADVGIAQGPFVLKDVSSWWLSRGLKALVPELVASNWTCAVLDVGAHPRPLARVFEVVQQVISSAGYRVDNRHAIDMSIAPRWQAGLLRADAANGSEGKEAQLKAELARSKSVRGWVDGMLRRNMFSRSEAEKKKQDGLWMSDELMGRMCEKIGYTRGAVPQCMAGSSAAVKQEGAEWDLRRLVKALNMVLGAAGLALKGKVSRLSAGGKGQRSQTMAYKLDGGRVAAMTELVKLRLRRHNRANPGFVVAPMHRRTRTRGPGSTRARCRCMGTSCARRGPSCSYSRVNKGWDRSPPPLSNLGQLCAR